MNEKYLVTACITTYNRPVYLNQALESVVGQTYDNLEILIMDDCSTDIEVEQVVKRFKENDKRIIYIKQNENKGVEYNFNLALKEAKGKYILWLCDDDWLEADYIQKCFQYKLENPFYETVYGSTMFYEGEKFAFYGAEITVEEETPFTRVLSFYDKQLGTANCPNFGIIEIDRIKNIPLKRILGHDNVWMGNIAFQGKIKMLNSTYIHRRLGGSSDSLVKSAATFNYSFFERYFSFIALFKNILFDVAWESPVYKSLGLFKRLSLAFCITVLISRNLFKYLMRYKKTRPRTYSESNSKKVLSLSKES